MPADPFADGEKNRKRAVQISPPGHFRLRFVLFRKQLSF